MRELLFLKISQRGRSSKLARSVSAQEIARFERAYVPRRFHVDLEAAAGSPFGGLIGSGWLTATLLMRLYTDEILLRSACLGSPGISEPQWRSPVRPGQVIHDEVTIQRVEPSAKRDERGLLRAVREFRDDDGEAIFSMTPRTRLCRRSVSPRTSESERTAP